jgi:hypothetical protein
MPSSVAVEGSSAWTVPAPSAIKLDAQARVRCIVDPSIFLSDPDPRIRNPELRIRIVLGQLCGHWSKNMLAKCTKSFNFVKY